MNTTTLAPPRRQLNPQTRRAAKNASPHLLNASVAALPALPALPCVATRREPVAHALAGACFLLLLAVGLVSNGYGGLNDQLKLAHPVAGWAGVMSGEPMQQFAAAMAHAPLPQTAASLERQLSWLGSRDLGPRVREGERDWLFLGDEFTPHARATASAASRAAEVIALRKRLAARGVDLLVVVVPDKSRTESAHLGALHRPPEFAGRVSQWTATLAQAGVAVLDLSSVLGALQQKGQQAFLRTDSHWSEAGAAAAAAQVAQRAARLGGGVGVGHATGTGTGLNPATGAGLQLTARATSPRAGDLVRLAGLDGLPLLLQPRPESVQQSHFEALVPGAPQTPGKNNDDLFGDVDLPSVALIGSSFSRTSNFAPFLALQLGAKVANFAVDGGDFAGAARAYLGSAAFKQTPPKLLIWEIPERVLQADRKGDHVE